VGGTVAGSVGVGGNDGVWIVGRALAVGVAVGLAVREAVGVGVAVRAGVALALGVGVADALAVGVGEGDPAGSTVRTTPRVSAASSPSTTARANASAQGSGPRRGGRMRTVSVGPVVATRSV
jgi:hypothetical protein